MVRRHQLVATNKLRNLRAQLESKLEMVMSDRFRIFLDLGVKAPLLVIPVDLNLGAASFSGRLTELDVDDFVAGGAPRDVARETAFVRDDDEGKQEEEEEAKDEGKARGPEQRHGGSDAGGTAAAAAATVVDSPPELFTGLNIVQPLSGPSGIAGSCSSSSAGRRRRELRRTPVATVAARTELLVVDLGSVNLTTSRLAHLRQQQEEEKAGGGGGRGGADATHTAVSSNPGENKNDGSMTNDDGNDDNSNSGMEGGAGPARGQRLGTGEGGRESNRGRVELSLSSSSTTKTTRRRRGGASGDVMCRGGGGAQEWWHANFYDVYNVEVCRAGVLLARRGVGVGGGGRGEGRGGGTKGGGSIEEGDWRAACSGTALGGGDGDAAVRRWLVDPFDVKVDGLCD